MHDFTLRPVLVTQYVPLVHFGIVWVCMLFHSVMRLSAELVRVEFAVNCTL